MTTTHDSSATAGGALHAGAPAAPPRPVPTAAAPAGGSAIDPATVAAWLARGECRLIDVREADEHARERIEGATNMPLSSLDPQRLASLAKQGQRVVIHCRSGARAADAVSRVLACAPKDTIVHSLEGGIERWRSAGLATQVDARVSRISVMRQVQLVIGVGVLFGSALAWFVHPGFVAITAFFGAGLTVAGASGTCGLAVVLARMPWNRLPAHACVRPE